MIKIKKINGFDVLQNDVRLPDEIHDHEVTITFKKRGKKDYKIVFNAKDPLNKNIEAKVKQVIKERNLEDYHIYVDNIKRLV